MRVRRGPGAWVHRHPTLVDGTMAALLLAVNLLINAHGAQPVWAYLLLVLAQVVPIAWRRRSPRVVFAIVGTATFVALATGPVPGIAPLGSLIALYTVATRCERPWSIGAGVLSWVGLMTALFVENRPESFRLQTVVAPLAVITATWLIGDNLRVRRAYVAQLEERAERIEADQEAEARRAADGERARIARELHDVVAHHVSVIAVQAGAARMVAESRPATSGEVPDGSDNMLASIEVTARQALSELRRLLGVLRKEEDQVDWAPQPGLSQLDSLVEQVRVAGVPIEVSVSGAVPGALSPGVDLSVYRIVQEALTNVMKHGGGAPTLVAMQFGDSGLDLAITDSGSGAPPPAIPGGATNADPAGGGHGIIGMRERVAMFGGELSAGPLPGGGYEVRAHIPCDREPS
ncbi:MAG TPA: sensor histidine kinase [Acidimicrobiales bacterium]|nr:sensor histidine kinase [Acidimicrobiales bacterium]